MTQSHLIKPWNHETLELGLRLLREGDVVAVPTETVYGLAGLSWNTQAIARIFAAKARPSFDPLIAHVPPSWTTLALLEKHEVIDLSKVSSKWMQTTEKLIQRFWPGPLTLLMPRHPKISELSCSGLPDVAVRMPAHPVFQALLEALQSPLSAPSANRFGRISPTCAEDVVQELAEEISLVIEGGPSQHGVESTILHVDPEGKVLCLRLGACPLEDITALLGYRPARVAKEHPTLAPGMLERHYAPGKSLWLIDGSEDLAEELRLLSSPQIAFLRVDPIPSACLLRLRKAHQLREFLLSPEGHDREAAQNLFSTLRSVDEGNFDLIIAECPPWESGLWPAIRDRLERAAIRKTNRTS